MITGFVRGQDFRLSQTVVAAEEGYATAQFVFQTGEWLAEGVVIYAHFRRNSDGGQTDAAVVDGFIPQSAELTLDAGLWTIWLTGHRYEEGALVQRLTTDTETLTVKPAGFVAAEPLPVRSFGESILGVVQDIYRDVADQLQAAATATDDQLAEQDEKVTNQLDDQNAAVTAQLAAQDGAIANQLAEQDEDISGRIRAQDTRINNQITAQNTAVTNQLAAQNTAVTNQLAAQNTSVENRLAQNESDVSTLLDANEADVDARLDENEAAVARMLGAVKNRRDDSFIQFWAGTEAQFEEAEKFGDTIYLIDLLAGGGDV